MYVGRFPDKKFCFFDKVDENDDAYRAVCVHFSVMHLVRSMDLVMDLMSSKVSMNIEMPVMIAIEPKAWTKKDGWLFLCLVKTKNSNASNFAAQPFVGIFLCLFGN